MCLLTSLDVLSLVKSVAIPDFCSGIFLLDQEAQIRGQLATIAQAVFGFLTSIFTGCYHPLAFNSSAGIVVA